MGYVRIFRWHVWRYLARHPLLALLNVFSVALGVAVFLATQIANQSANRAFAATIDLVAGKADLEITSPAGNAPESILPLVMRDAGVAAATPIVRGVVSLPDFPGEYFDVLGIDIFTNEPFRTFDVRDFSGEGFDVERWLRGPNVIAISEDFARQHNIAAGSVLRAQLNGVDRELSVGFVLPTRGTIGADPHFAAMDLGWAQEFFSQRGKLNSIELRLRGARDPGAVAAHLRALIPPDVVVATPARRGDQINKMLGGFELNLTAMSLVSLLVGMFLIYNTVSASVVRRRREIGILRSLGVRRNEVQALFLGEALLLGFVGSLCGLLGGIALARVLVTTVASTISSLYVLVSVNAATIEPWMLLVSLATGLGSVVVAAWFPARAAANLSPVRALTSGEIIERSIDLSPGWLLGAAASMAMSFVLSIAALTTGPPWIGFGAAFFVLLGFSLFVPHATLRFSSLADGVLRAWRTRTGRGFLEMSLAAANLPRALMRNSVTIAALASAIAMTVGISVMVFSFRKTVEAWIDQTLVADLFIAPASNEITGPTSFLPAEAVEFLRTHEGVTAVNTFREIQLLANGEETAVAAVGGEGERRMPFVKGDGNAILRRLRSEQVVIVSESFARRRHVHDGDVLHFATPEGVQDFPIIGTFYDYTRDSGVVYMSAKNFIRLWRDERVTSAAVYLGQGVAAKNFTADFRARFSKTGQFAIFSNASLRQRVFEIFDQTFAVTYVLRTIAVIVAVLGIFLGLTILISERSREFAVMRAIGGGAAQIRQLLLWESAMIGALAAVIGLASGVGLSVVLTGVINRAFFGWTIRVAFPWWSIVMTPAWIIVAAIGAGVVPAWRAGQMKLTDALRSE